MFLLQSNCISYNNHLKVVHALGDSNIPFITFDIVPFTTQINFHEPIEGLDHYLYGSTSAIKAAVEKNYTHTFFDEKIFKSSVYNDKRHDMLNQDAAIITFGKLESYVLDRFKEDDHLFIKPNNDLKLFVGEVTSRKNFMAWLDKLKGWDIVKSTDEVVVNEAKNIIAEYRCFIVDGWIESTSMYKKDGHGHLKNLDQAEGLIKEFQRMADYWLPNHNCVMDFALMRNNRMKVIEFNCINASGFYDHDIPKVMKAINKVL